MKKIALVLSLSLPLAPLSAVAQEADEGFSLMEEGARLFFRGMMDEMQPAIDDLAGLAERMGPAFDLFVREMGPAFAEVIGQIDSLDHYAPPVILPNGDIILRRKPDAPVWVPPEAEEVPGGEVDL